MSGTDPVDRILADWRLAQDRGEVIDPEDAEMLQDLILAAVNDGMTRAKNMVNEEMGKLTKGLNMPGIPGLT